MVIFTDSREKARAIKKILSHFDSEGIEHFSTKLFVGDYMCPDNPLVFVDRKQGITEIAQNATSGHKRFKAELERAKRIGAKLYVLIEQDKYGDTVLNDIGDIICWKSTYGQIVGEQVYRILASWRSKYDLEFVFCNKKNTGKEIIRLLGGGND